jgi:streptogramin lyase
VARRLIRIALLIAPVVATMSASVAPASAMPLGEVRSIPTIMSAGGLAAGPEGEMWVGAGEATVRVTTGEPPVLTPLNTSMAPSGEIVAGSDGNMWYARNSSKSEVTRITPAGAITEFNKEAEHAPRSMTLGPDGNVWYTAGVPGLKKLGEEYETSAIGRITPAGQVTEFTAGLSTKPLLGQITTGSDGNLWFVNDGNPFTIGRITPTGEIKEFTIEKKPWLKPSGIAAGIDGNVYFGASGENEGEETESLIMQITPTGAIMIAKQLSDSEPVELATGPEGSVWFTADSTELGQPNVIGRLTPEGRLEEHLLILADETFGHAITPGPDGNMWFTTAYKGVRRVGVIGTGAPAASQAPPVVTGVDEPGNELSCTGAGWSTWAGQQPSTSAYGFDGYTWLLDGAPIPGQNGQSLLVSTADVGDQISCAVTATYRLLNVTVSSPASADVSIVPVPPSAPPTPPAVSLLTLPHQTDAIASGGALHVTLDCSGAPCSGTIKLIFKTKVTTGKGKHRHTKSVSTTIATGTFSSLAVGADKVALKLNGHGLSLLKSHSYKLAAGVSISYVASGGSHVSATGTIGLAGKEPKHRHKAG